MNSNSFRSAGVWPRLLVALLAGSFLSLTSLFAQGPLLPAKKSEFHEQPAKRVFDLKPATAKLPAAPDRSAKMPALQEQAILGPIPSWTWLGPAGVNGQTE